jgi:hypothetical protein
MQKRAWEGPKGIPIFKQRRNRCLRKYFQRRRKKIKNLNV